MLGLKLLEELPYNHWVETEVLDHKFEDKAIGWFERNVEASMIYLGKLIPVKFIFS